MKVTSGLASFGVRGSHMPNDDSRSFSLTVGAYTYILIVALPKKARLPKKAAVCPKTILPSCLLSSGNFRSH